MKINKPYTNEEYAKLAIYCNENGLIIVDKGEYLESEKYQPTQEEIKAARLDELKSLLAAADYWGQKYIDGEYTPEEWEEKKAQRKAWREEIRSLENSVDSDG